MLRSTTLRKTCTSPDGFLIRTISRQIRYSPALRNSGCRITSRCDNTSSIFTVSSFTASSPISAQEPQERSQDLTVMLNTSSIWHGLDAGAADYHSVPSITAVGQNSPPALT
jgi:hypothetical protein